MEFNGNGRKKRKESKDSSVAAMTSAEESFGPSSRGRVAGNVDDWGNIKPQQLIPCLTRDRCLLHSAHPPSAPVRLQTTQAGVAWPLRLPNLMLRPFDRGRA